jgi:predicted ester cyclase
MTIGALNAFGRGARLTRMKLRTSIMIAALAVGGCSKKKDDPKAADPTPKTSEPGKPDPAKPDPNAAKPDPNAKKEPKLEGEALAKKYIACTDTLNAAKFDEFKKDCLAADYKGHMAGGPDVPNADAVVGFFKGMKAGFSDLKFSPQLVVVNGRNIYGVGLMTGTNNGDFKTPDGMDVKKTDKKIGVLMFHKLAINDENKAAEEWEFQDPMAMMGQLGLVPKEAGPTRPALDKGLDGAPVIVVAKDDATEKKNLEAFSKTDAALNEHKPADILALVADDAVESDQADSKDIKGKKAIEAGLKGFFAAFPDLKLEDHAAIAAGDYVIEIGTVSGTNKGPLGPIKATGKSVKMPFAEVAKFKDGKIVELWRFRNGADTAMQLGLMPAPGAPKGDAPKGDAPKGDAPKGDAPKGGAAPTPKKEEKKAGGGW